MRKIAVITGTRAEYGIFKPILKKIRESEELTLSLIVTGMHMLEEFGYTVEEIEKDGFTIDVKIPGLYTKDTKLDMAKSVGEGVITIAEALERISPDILLLLGDRGEMFAGAVAATYLNIGIAHLHGGEISGSIDGVVRHAITKLAHIHLPATEESARRIIKMGEDPAHVIVVGAPGLDSVFTAPLVSPEALSKKYGFTLDSPLLLVVQHPVATEFESAPSQMRETLEAVKALDMQAIVIYPNADAGGRKMIEVIKEYATFVKTYRSIPHTDYLSLMKIAHVLVGNSSSGIIEAPSFKLPVVNIGTRQDGRERAENVIEVSYDREEIKKGIEKALSQPFRERVQSCINPYGDGKASSRIVRILSELSLENLPQKRWIE